MTEIGAYDAKTHLPALLERVRRGERFIITKHGQPVAELRPFAGHDADRARRAVAEMRKLRKELAARGVRLRKILDEGESLRDLARLGASILMPFVIDSSVALAWVLPDEQGSPADVLADALEKGPACAPAPWPLEVGNALVLAQRRKRLTEKDLDRVIKVLESLAVELDATPVDEAFPAVMVIARKLGLTTYDAAYLELAQRRGLPLATLDARLADCGRKLGVVVLP